MTRLALRLTATLVSSSCAHGAGPAVPPAEVVWPAPPAPPRARLVGAFPDRERPGPTLPAWRRVLHALAGIEPGRPSPWLVRPFGVSAPAGGSFLVADPDAPAVLRVDPEGRAEPVACRGREWAAPMAVAAATDGLFVADAGAAEVVRIDGSGRCHALGAGALERPTGLVVAGGLVYVTDPPRHEVVALSPDGSVALRFGGPGAGDGRMHFPTAIAAAPDGTLLVVDALNFRVSRFDRSGRWLGSFGAPGETGGALARPKGVAADSRGRVYVSDAQRDLVLVYRADGTFDFGLGASGSQPGELLMPAGLSVAGEFLYVADSQNARVQVFELMEGRQ